MKDHDNKDIKTFSSDGASIEYSVQGDGEPLLLIHGAMVADAWTPVLSSLSERYQVITYHRRGYGGSSPVPEDNTVAEEARYAVALLDHLNITKAHIAGHSFGGVTALQLAVDFPTRVHSLALLEPALMSVPAGEQFGAGVQAVAEIFIKGDAKGALDAFLSAVGGDNAHEILNETLETGWYDVAIADIKTLFTGDLVALGSWQFGPDEVASITAPALAILGSESPDVFKQTHSVLIEYLPAVESYELKNATHLQQMGNPEPIAARLIEFFAHHPMSNG